MAKVTHPLHGLAAHGSIGGVLVYRSNSSERTARLSPRHAPPLNSQQRKRAAIFALAAAQWRLQPAPVKAKWAANAALYRMPTLARWIQQFMRQNCSHSRNPRIPL